MHPTRGGGSGRGSWRGSGWTHMPPLSTQRQANDEEHVAEEHVAAERVERDELPQLIPTVYWCAAEHRNLAFQDWSRACQKRLKNHATTAGKDLNKKPVWMADDVWENFKKRREDPNFQACSKRHKDNKIRGSERDGNKIVAGHHQGSISSVELAQRMRKEKGTMPSAADLFLRSHSKMEGSQRVLATDKARRTMVEYERLMSHYQSQGIEKHPDMVFYEAVGGHKKGQVYGLGESAPMYFEPSTFRSFRASSYDVHSMMSIDRQTFEEMQRSITHLTQRVEHLESQTRGGCHDFTPFSRDPRDPHNGATGSSASFTAAV